MSLTGKVVAEFLGTAFLLIVVVGSGIMAESLAGGNDAVALLANSLATGAGLFVLIQCLGPLSGAHLNPAVSLIERLWGRLSSIALLGYWGAQFAGGITGVLATHAMFNLELLQISEKSREGFHLAFSEFIATFGLLAVIALAGRKRVEWAPVTVAAYITGAYWFTSSTSFANPAVTLARAWTNTFCGIAPSGIWAFFAAQVLGALTAFTLLRFNSDSK
ncbi:MAG TPA: MIP/aquaporin family protein [Bdellovibrionales bacterium]|nr:MIP/aquaporin family protein [Bdellovibrionales bacterium]